MTGVRRKEQGTNAIRRALAARYVEVQYHFVQFVVDHLVDCRRSMGDFDDVMILAILGQRRLEARRDHDVGEPAAAKRVWMSASRLSDVTSIPRETVRRKLVRLRDRGWIEEDAALGWRIAGTADVSKVRDDLADLDSRGMDRLSRLVSGLMPLLDAGNPVESGDG
jgi:hypothetical protein